MATVNDILNEVYTGTSITLAASAARTDTAGTNGTGVAVGAYHKRYLVLLTVTAAATAADDTLDVYVDWSLDDTTYINGGHFTQVVGNGGAKKYYMVFDSNTPGTSVIDATSDANAAAVRPALFGAYLRTRWVIVDAGTDNASFTFSVVAYGLP